VILLVEYAAAAAIQALTGARPWEYTSGRHVHGRIRLDYAPLWAIFGLALERLGHMMAACAGCTGCRW
jgi:uncharacterized membrane protein